MSSSFDFLVLSACGCFLSFQEEGTLRRHYWTRILYSTSANPLSKTPLDSQFEDTELSRP